MKKRIVILSLAGLALLALASCKSVEQQSAEYQARSTSFAQACQPLHLAAQQRRAQ